MLVRSDDTSSAPTTDEILQDYATLESDRQGRAIWTGREKSNNCRGSVTHLKENEATLLRSHRGYGKTPYPPDYDCRWLLIPQDCDLGLECDIGTYRNLRRSRSFEKCVGADYLRVLGYRGTLDSFYCGDKGPNVTFYGDNAVALVFKSNERKSEEELQRQSFGIAGFNCKVVCRPRESVKSNSTTTTTTTTPRPGSATLLPQNTSSRPIKFSTHRPGKTTGRPGVKPPPCHCGEARQARIVCPKGHNCTAGLGEIPWQAGLVSVGSNQPWCGGSLVNSRYVLTAAHCMASKTARRIQVVLGDHDWTTKSEGPDYRFGVSEIIRHPRFGKRAQYDFDFALLKLDREVDFNRMYRVRPVCLPDDRPLDLVGREGTASGWGVVNPKIPNQQARKLQQVFVKILSNQECVAKYVNNPVTETMICAQDKDTDACYGDSGGPFTVRDFAGKSVLEGVISWGKNCAQERWPGVYSRVRSVLPWIRQNMRAGEFCFRDDRVHRALDLDNLGRIGDLGEVEDLGEDDKEDSKDGINFEYTHGRGERRS